MLALRSILIVLSILAGLMSFTEHAETASSTLTFSHKHFLFTVRPRAEWRQREKRWYFLGLPAEPSPQLLVQTGSALPPHWELKDEVRWDEDAILATLRKDVFSRLERPAGRVSITRTETGSIIFDGNGLTGRRVSSGELIALTIEALERDIEFVVLPVQEIQPEIQIDPGLLQRGVREVVAIGESDFTGSPVNRRHNIGVGVKRFNGHIIPRGDIFSFNATLGPVNYSTGYRKELVILGDETIPDYGGGLCQVSSTAYRGPWEAGLPIVTRRNHSYTVGYYSPQGTDATIYPPRTDFQFRNDTPGDLLIQTFTEGNRAYFVYYGTRDTRRSEVFGPYRWDFVAAPKEERYVYTSEIPVGELRKAGEAHDGMKVLWYRLVTTATGSVRTEPVYSFYEARPLTYQIGVPASESRSATGGTLSVPPSWLPSSR